MQYTKFQFNRVLKSWETAIWKIPIDDHNGLMVLKIWAKDMLYYIAIIRTVEPYLSSGKECNLLTKLHISVTYSLVCTIHLVEKKK